MKKLLALIAFQLVIIWNVPDIFAQEQEVRVLVRQVGTSSYFYKVVNNSQKDIRSFQLGFNENRKGSEEELTIEPSAIEQPQGWTGRVVFLEESDLLHIRWYRETGGNLISSGSSLDGFVAYMPQPYDLMKQTSFTVLFLLSQGADYWLSSTVELDTSPPTLFDGKGQRSQDVNTFLGYLRPTEAQTTLSQGQTTYYLLIFYGKTILPETFKATLNDIDINGDFHPTSDSSEVVKLNLKQGRNILALSVDGTRNDGNQATDTDRLVFIVP